MIQVQLEVTKQNNEQEINSQINHWKTIHIYGSRLIFNSEARKAPFWVAQAPLWAALAHH